MLLCIIYFEVLLCFRSQIEGLTRVIALCLFSTTCRGCWPLCQGLELRAFPLRTEAQPSSDGMKTCYGTDFNQSFPTEPTSSRRLGLRLWQNLGVPKLEAKESTYYTACSPQSRCQSWSFVCKKGFVHRMLPATRKSIDWI